MPSLIVGFPDVPIRNHEYDLCLRRNTLNPHIAKVIICVEELPSNRNPRSYEGPKVEFRNVGHRATFSEMLAVANGLKGVVILANADVYFDWSVAKLDDTPRDVFMAITRTDCLRDNLYCSDAWAFWPPLLIPRCDFTLGRSQCENEFSARAENSGRKIWNPGFEVCLRHVHSGGRSTWSPDHEHKVPCAYAPKPVLVTYKRGRFIPRGYSR